MEKGLKALEIEIRPEAAEKLIRLADLLIYYARPLGLTSLDDPLEILEKHIIDSLTPLPLIASGACLLDVGSGAGLPGLPLKIVHPDLKLTLIEPRRKRVTFMTYAVGALGLSGVKIMRCYLGKDCQGLEHKGYQVVISRAFTDLKTFYNLAWPYVAPQGVLVAMKGPRVEEELALLPEAFRRQIKVKKLRLPFSQARRCLVFMIKGHD
ncbi:16S rRNA (guanine(527)-N(7))-methyltransferase RsmG [Thermosulfuriphilus sp.]